MDLDTSALDSAPHDLVSLTAEVVSAYLSNNSVPPSELPELMSTVHTALGALGQPKVPIVEKPVPHMSIKKTITPEALISLEDGKSYKTLKRHLTGRGLTPAQYREKWGLPADYPMAAPNYSARRSELARASGLGANRQKSLTRSASPDPVVQAPAKKRRGRKAKV